MNKFSFGFLSALAAVSLTVSVARADYNEKDTSQAYLASNGGQQSIDVTDTHWKRLDSMSPAAEHCAIQAIRTFRLAAEQTGLLAVQPGRVRLAFQVRQSGTDDYVESPSVDFANGTYNIYAGYDPAPPAWCLRRDQSDLVRLFTDWVASAKRRRSSEDPSHAELLKEFDLLNGQLSKNDATPVIEQDASAAKAATGPAISGAAANGHITGPCDYYRWDGSIWVFHADCDATPPAATTTPAN